MRGVRQVLTPAQLRAAAAKSAEREVRATLRRTGMGSRDAQAAIRELGGAVDFGAQVIRFARGDAVGGLFGALLGNMGPVGVAIKAILGTRKLAAPNSRDVQRAVEFLTDLGLEVRLPGATNQPTASGSGATGTGGGGTTPPQNRPPTGNTGQARVPPSGRTTPRSGRTGDGAGEGGDEPSNLPTGRFVQDKYIPMELVSGSSNVYAIGYQADTQTMRVQYLGTALSMAAIKGTGHRGKGRAKGKLGKTVTGKRGGPGPVYDYFNVPPRVFARVQRASSKGKAIWSNLRIRGTVYGHQYDYQLAAASVADVINAAGRRVAKITYVPRKAVGPGQFKGRDIRQGVGRQAQNFRSILPNVGMRRRRP